MKFYWSPKPLSCAVMIASSIAMWPASSVAAPSSAIRSAASVAIEAAPEPAAASCRVLSIVAKKDGDGSIPSNLKALESELRSDQFAAYKSFELVEEKSVAVTNGADSSVAMKIGYDVKLRLLAIAGARLKLHLSLLGKGGAKPLLDADYSVQNGGVLLVVAGKRDQGRALFAFQCRAR